MRRLSAPLREFREDESMATSLSNDLLEFHRFVAEKLANGQGNLSPEEVVDQWRELHPAPEGLGEPEKLAADVAAVREALVDMAAGDTGIFFENFDGEFRGAHNLPPRS
jgi:hypothetical protein